MKILQEFKEFAMKGNVVDMSVGVIIGGAFGKIVTSLVNDVIMPPIGVLLNGVNFRDLKYIISQAITDAEGVVIKPEVSIMYGAFIQTVLDFLIIAICIFAMIKTINSIKRKEKAKPEQPAPPTPPSEEIILLREIRDALKQ